MDRRISALAATAAVMAMPLLAACGSSARPSSSPATPAAPPTSPATIAASPSSTPAATPTAKPVKAPSSDPKKQTPEVEAAAEKFVHTGLTLGYPDKSFDVYLDRLEPLMTEQAFAEARKYAKGKQNLDKAWKTLYAKRARTTPKITSDVKVTSITASTAKAELDYKLATQVRSGGGWKSLQTASKEDVEVELVLDDGHWLVEDAS